MPIPPHHISAVIRIIIHGVLFGDDLFDLAVVAYLAAEVRVILFMIIFLFHSMMTTMDNDGTMEMTRAQFIRQQGRRAMSEIYLSEGEDSNDDDGHINQIGGGDNANGRR